jgi:hypothetical protein
VKRPQDLLVLRTLVLPARLARWTDELVAGAEVTGEDPLLLAAIMDRESLGGDALIPKGPAGTGDWRFYTDVLTGKRHRIGALGHGRGLMQVDDRHHAEWIARLDGRGVPLWQKPFDNIAYGARLLAANRRFLVRALAGYPPSVVAAAAVASYNCGLRGALRHLRKLGPKAPELNLLVAADASTTGCNYSRDVLSRRAAFHANALRAGAST